MKPEQCSGIKMYGPSYERGLRCTHMGKREYVGKWYCMKHVGEGIYHQRYLQKIERRYKRWKKLGNEMGWLRNGVATMTIKEWADSRLAENEGSEEAFVRFLAFCAEYQRSQLDQPAEEWDRAFAEWQP